MRHRRVQFGSARRASIRACGWVVLVAMGLISLLPSEQRTLGPLECWSGGVNTWEAARDDRTEAVPAQRVTYRHKMDLMAGQTGVRGGAPGAVWSARSHAVPPVLAKSLLMMRCLVDAVRAGALASASDDRLASEAHLAAAVATSVQFLC